MNRLGSDSIDAALHLLDRQVIDADGMMVCNVDDLELSDRGDGSLAVTGLLAGGAALFPRYSGRAGVWLRTTWDRLGVQFAHRDTPMYLGLGLVAELGSALTLRVSRDGLLDRQPPPAAGIEHRRMSLLLSMDVIGPEGRLGNILDVRLVPDGEAFDVHQLVVGRGRPGSLLGFERGNVHGPWLVDRAVNWLHRHTGQVDWEHVVDVSWRDATITVDRPLEPLAPS